MELLLHDTAADERAGKVPAVTLGFWVIKILATTLGETGGDAVTMSMNLGYLVGTAIFAIIFAVAVAAQMAAKHFHPLLYWTVIIATTTVGTTFADFVDRSLGIGYLGGSSLLAGLLVVSLAAWHRTMGTVSIASIDNKAAETFYWITILFSQTLGTALGDWMADSTGLGYGGGASTLTIDGRDLAFAWSANGDGIDLQLDGVRSRIAHMISKFFSALTAFSEVPKCVSNTVISILSLSDDQSANFKVTFCSAVWS